MQYTVALDCLNFFLADVRGGLGPYVGVFLLTEAHWDQATLGAVLTVSGILGITLHTPIGAFIVSTHATRGLIIAGVVLLSVSAVGTVLCPVWLVVHSAE